MATSPSSCQTAGVPKPDFAALPDDTLRDLLDNIDGNIAELAALLAQHQASRLTIVEELRRRRTPRRRSMHDDS